MVIKMVNTGNLLYEYTSLKKLWKTLILSELKSTTVRMIKIVK